MAKTQNNKQLQYWMTPTDWSNQFQYNSSIPAYLRLSAKYDLPAWYRSDLGNQFQYKSQLPVWLQGPDKAPTDLRLVPKTITYTPDTKGYLAKMSDPNRNLLDLYSGKEPKEDPSKQVNKEGNTYENLGGGIQNEPGGVLGLIPKYAAIGANVLLNARNINKMYDIEKQKVLPQVFAARVPIVPEQDIPPELLQERKNLIAHLRSQYSGSDAVLDTVAKNMVEQEKFNARNKLAADRAAQLQQEKARVIKEQAENAKANVEAMNKREQIRATEDARQREIAKMRLEALNKLRTDTINAGVKEFENYANYEAERKLRTEENKRKQLMSEINYNLQIANTPGVDPGTRDDALEKVKTLNGAIKKLDLSLPSYGGIYRIFSKRNGGKLIAKS